MYLQKCINKSHVKDKILKRIKKLICVWSKDKRDSGCIWYAQLLIGKDNGSNMIEINV